MRGPFPRRLLPKPPTTTSRARRRHLHIHHVHLPTQWPTYTPYLLASSLQTTLAAPHHAHKASPTTTPAPNAILLSFTPTPTYTLGRRQRSLPASQLTTLSAPLSVHDPFLSPAKQRQPLLFTPEIHHSLRGGLTTYHGPGQLVLWPIIDLRSPHHPHLSVRAYASLLEDTTASVLRERFGISTFRDEENPGVWVRGNTRQGPPDRKIAALGIHLRRHITTLGLALNITVPTSGDAGLNPWARFTPCGIPDRDVTSVAAEIGADLSPDATEDVRRELDLEVIAGAWCAEFKRRLEAGG